MRRSEMRDCGFIIMPVRKEQQPASSGLRRCFSFLGNTVLIHGLFFFSGHFIAIILLSFIVNNRNFF